MSQDIVSVRGKIKQVSSSLRQGNPVSAVQAVSATLRLMLTTPLMKAERDEFAGLVREAIDYINNDSGIRKIYPLALAYAPGGEKQLFEEMQELLEVLKDDTMSGVAKLAAAAAAKKESALAKGREHLENKEYDHARAVFKTVTGEFPDDGALHGAIGEKYLNAGLYEDAASSFAAAVTLDPKALHNYNRLAIVLRKLGRFDIAEGYYLRALPLAPEDPNLLFNMGRLYLEWKKWDKAVEYGEKAHAARPDFAEARKLAEFARKRME